MPAVQIRNDPGTNKFAHLYGHEKDVALLIYQDLTAYSFKDNPRQTQFTEILVVAHILPIKYYENLNFSILQIYLDLFFMTIFIEISS